jgi:Bacterial archaeo-eukaryotic release factor family 10
MRFPDESAVKDLLAWRPALPVISVYLDLHPEDRGEAWRIELEHRLAAEVKREAARHQGHKAALEQTAKRIQAHLETQPAQREGRTHIGFVEVAGKRAREEWFELQLPLEAPAVFVNNRPVVLPLLTLIDDGATRGVAVVSSERVRLFVWAYGHLSEIADTELEITSLDWRERKAQRPGDPARVHGAKAAGRDQYGQRLEANRDRFLREAGELAVAELSQRDVDELLVFGDTAHVREFGDGVGARATLRAAGDRNLIAAPAAEIEAQTTAAIEGLNRERELELVSRVVDEAKGGTRGALGAQETSQALAEGRVEHLLLDPERDYRDTQIVALDGDDEDVPVPDRLVAAALATSARVTPVEGEAAERLAPTDGLAALLRY